MRFNMPKVLRSGSTRSLAGDERGATILEFGLIAPTLCVMLLGALDVGHTLYMQSVLQGAVQKAARDGTLQTAAGDDDAQRFALDTAVKRQVLRLNKSADVKISRRFYRTFTEAQAQAEETFSDTNGDAICNFGEPFDDRNSNGVRDTDGADSVNNANARDNVVYTVSLSYPRMFPIDKLLGGKGTTDLSATTVLANQPFGAQEVYGAPTVGHCP
jgi:Flp pilus assembly protein TadG